jgi:hypothetical protein
VIHILHAITLPLRGSTWAVLIATIIIFIGYCQIVLSPVLSLDRFKLTLEILASIVNQGTLSLFDRKSVSSISKSTGISVICWSLGIMIISSIYSGEFVSFLTVKPDQNLPPNLKELVLDKKWSSIPVLSTASHISSSSFGLRHQILNQGIRLYNTNNESILKRYRDLYNALYVRLWEPANYLYTGKFLFNITFGHPTLMQQINLTESMTERPNEFRYFPWCRKMPETFTVIDFPVGIRVYKEIAATFGVYEDPSVTKRFEGPTILEEFNVMSRNQANWLGEPFYRVAAWLDNTGIHGKWEQEYMRRRTFEEILEWKLSLQKANNKCTMDFSQNERLQSPTQPTVQMESIISLFKLFFGQGSLY